MPVAKKYITRDGIRTLAEVHTSDAPAAEPAPYTDGANSFFQGLTADSVVGAIMDYECGDLDEDGTIALFQHLLDTGLCNTLQGHYGRTTQELLHAGYISRKA